MYLDIFKNKREQKNVRKTLFKMFQVIFVAFNFKFRETFLSHRVCVYVGHTCFCSEQSINQNKTGRRLSTYVS